MGQNAFPSTEDLDNESWHLTMGLLIFYLCNSNKPGSNTLKTIPTSPTKIPHEIWSNTDDSIFSEVCINIQQNVYKHLLVKLHYSVQLKVSSQNLVRAYRNCSEGLSTSLFLELCLASPKFDRAP